jgi:hypothetical protein
MAEQPIIYSPSSSTRLYALRGLPPISGPDANDDIPLINANLAQAQRRGDLSGLAIDGVQPGSEQDLFLRYYVYRFSVPAQWGREYRRLLPVSRATQGGPPPQLGRIILSWSPKGYCTARLVACGPVMKADATAEVSKAEEVLRAKVGIRAVTSRGRDWTAPQLRVVTGALAAKVPQEDRAALKGVDVVRMPAVGDAEPDADAKFYCDQVDDGQAKVDLAELRVGDGAFSDDDQAFVGTDPAASLPVSCLKVLHEVGHAVEKAGVRRARSAEMAAKTELEQAAAEVKAARPSPTEVQVARYEKAQLRYDKAVDATKRARGKTNLGSVALEEFVAYVNERKISPRLTGYASENWPEKPQELYADAYALSLADPQFLNAFFPDLAAYFKKGAYRPPA